MKHLYLMRHAKSSWMDSEWYDFERPLNNRGRMDAPLMGVVLKEKAGHVDLILTSPSCRTMMTARLVAEEMDYLFRKIEVEELIYEASPEQLFEVVTNLPSDKDSVLMVGHNPGFSLLLEKLTGHYDSMPTAAIAGLELDINNWSECVPEKTKLLFYEVPKKHK